MTKENEGAVVETFGMWDVDNRCWNADVLRTVEQNRKELVKEVELESLLGEVVKTPEEEILGVVAPYFVDRYGFNKECQVMSCKLFMLG